MLGVGERWTERRRDSEREMGHSGEEGEEEEEEEEEGHRPGDPHPASLAPSEQKRPFPACPSWEESC